LLESLVGKLIIFESHIFATFRSSVISVDFPLPVKLI
jgi:hypothetical protein